ncbi:MAG: glycerol acyltransferase, partial [Haliscomenobacter sp.]
MLEKKGQVYPHVIPEISDWPIFRLSEARKDFIQEMDQFTVERLLSANSTSRMTDIIAQTIYMERIRMQEEPWKVDPPTDKAFWSRLRRRLTKECLDKPQEVAALGNEALLKEIVHRYSEEIVGTFRIKTFLFARKFLTIFFNRLLQAKLRGVFRLGGGRRRLSEKLTVEGHLDTVRSLATRGTLVVVP